MSASFVARAVILRSVAFGEADRILTLFSRAHGKISALARGARRSRSRFGGALALFVEGEAMLKERRGADLMVMEQFAAVNDYSRLASDVVSMAHASYGTELVRELTVARQADAGIFDLLIALYATVVAAGPRADTLRAFELKLLDELGMRPVLDRCVACGRSDEAALDVAAVEPARGGLLCAACTGRQHPGGGHSGQAASVALPPGARARLVALRDAKTLAEAAALAPAEREDAAAARRASFALLAAHLRAPVKSLEFIQQLRGER